MRTDPVGVLERMGSPCQQAQAKVEFPARWQASYFSTHPQSMLPLAAAQVALPYRRLPVASFLFLFSLLHYFSPAVTRLLVSQSELDRLRRRTRQSAQSLTSAAAARAMSTSLPPSSCCESL